MARGTLTRKIASFLKEDEALAQALVAYVESITQARPVSLNTALSGYAELVIGYDARVTITDRDIRATSTRLTRYALNDLTEKVTAFTEKECGPVAQRIAVKRLRETFGKQAILENTPLSNGARLVRVRVSV